MKTQILTIVLMLFSVRAFCAPELEKVVVASELIELMGLKDTTEACFNAMLPTLEPQFQQLGLGAEEREELIEIYRKWFFEDIDHDSIRDRTVAIYADAFTIDELNGLIDFYKSPLGKKTLKKLPELTQLGVQLGMDETNAKQQELFARLTPFFQRLEEKRQSQQ